MSGEQENAASYMLECVFGLWKGLSLSTTAELGIADALVDGPKTTAEIAAAINANEAYLGRLLTSLKAQAVLTQDAEGRWHNTARSLCLVTSETSLRHYFMTVGQGGHLLPWGRLTQAIQTGNSGVHLAFDNKEIWEVFQENPHWQETFDRSMSSLSKAVGATVADAIKTELAGVPVVMDIGGSRGYLITQILAAAESEGHKEMKGVCMDQPHVVEAAAASPLQEWSQLGDRVEFLGGDFFASLPEQPANAIITMKHILHDWDDERSLKILQTCHQALKSGGRIMACEMILSDSDVGSTLMDLNMLAVSGGQERSEEQYKQLFEKAGFTYERVLRTSSMVSVVVGTRVADS